MQGTAASENLPPLAYLVEQQNDLLVGSRPPDQALNIQAAAAEGIPCIQHLYHNIRSIHHLHELFVEGSPATVCR